MILFKQWFKYYKTMSLFKQNQASGDCSHWLCASDLNFDGEAKNYQELRVSPFAVSASMASVAFLGGFPSAVSSADAARAPCLAGCH